MIVITTSWFKLVRDWRLFVAVLLLQFDDVVTHHVTLSLNVADLKWILDHLRAFAGYPPPYHSDHCRHLNGAIHRVTNHCDPCFNCAIPVESLHTTHECWQTFLRVEWCDQDAPRSVVPCGLTKAVQFRWMSSFSYYKGQPDVVRTVLHRHYQ